MNKLKKLYQKLKPKDYLTFAIRAFLVAVIAYFVIDYMTNSISRGWDWANSQNGELIFVTLLALGLTFTFDFLEKSQNIRVPYIISSTSILFIFCSLFLGEVANFYTHFWWWDDLLHLFSGIILGLIGFLMVYFLNSRYSVNLSPVLVGLFSLTFAVFLGVLWEIFEFTVDALTEANMQRWHMESDAFLIGKDYQGVGLRDTMSDLIVDMFGGLMAGFYAYYIYKKDKSGTLKLMERTFGKKKSKS